MSKVDDLVKKMESLINKEKNYNQDNKKHTVGAAMQAVSSVVMFAKNSLYTMGVAEDAEFAKEDLYRELLDFYQLSEKIQQAAETNPNIELKDVLYGDELKRYEEITSGFTHIEVYNESLSACRDYLNARGVPRTEMASTKEGKSIIVVPKKYLSEAREMRRVLAINQKYGLAGIDEFARANPDNVKMQIANIDAWEAELINLYMKEERIPGGLSFTNNNPDELKCTISYRMEDDIVMQKILLRAEMTKMALLNPKSDLILKNRLNGQAKDRMLLAKAAQMSQFTDFYICSESIDKYIKLTQEGFTLYSKGKAIEEYKRDDLSEEKFNELFNEAAGHIQYNNMVILQDKDIKGNRDEALKLMNSQEGRKKLIVGKHANTIDVASYDSEMIKQLMRSEYLSPTEMIKRAQEMRTSDSPEHEPFTAAVFLYDVASKYVDIYKADQIPYSVGQFISNTEGVPSVADVVQSIKDYAVAYAKNAQVREWMNASKSIEQQINFTDEEIAKIQEQVGKAQREFKESIESLKTTYNLPDSIITQLTQGIATTLNATVDLEAGKIEFDTNLEKVQSSAVQIDKLLQNTYRLSQNIEERKGEVRAGTLQQLIDRDRINQESVVSQENEKNKRDSELSK